MPGSEHDRPCVIVLHEVWGPDASIESACKRLRKLGFATAVPDLYKGYGLLLTPRSIRSAMEVVWDLSLEDRRDKKKVAAEVARKGADATTREVLAVMYDQGFRDGMVDIALGAIMSVREKHPRVATLGFSLGGGISLICATKSNGPDAAVAYCGEPPKLGGLKRPKAPMLLICANHDELMNPLMPEFVQAARDNGIDLTVRTFPDTEHDFFNETMKDRYNHAASEDAWALTTRFLSKTLRPRRPLSKR